MNNENEYKDCDEYHLLNEEMKEELENINKKISWNYPKKWKNSYNFSFCCIKINGLILKNFSYKFRNNSKMVLNAIKNNPFSIEFASPRIKKNRKMVLLLCKYSGWCIKFCDKKFRDDYEIMCEAVKSYPYSFEFATDNLKQNENFALHAIKNGVLLLYFNNEIKKNIHLCMNAIKKYKYSIYQIDQSIRTSSNIVMIAILKYFENENKITSYKKNIFLENITSKEFNKCANHYSLKNEIVLNAFNNAVKYQVMQWKKCITQIFLKFFPYMELNLIEEIVWEFVPINKNILYLNDVDFLFKSPWN
jgi:hypothetical protein